MSIHLRALFGPFGRTTDSMVGRSGQVYPARNIDWHFFGIREDNSMGRWGLRFEIETRKFKLVNYPMPEKPVVHEDAFVPDGPMIWGRTYNDILRARLTDEDLAFAMSKVMTGGR